MRNRNRVVWIFVAREAVCGPGISSNWPAVCPTHGGFVHLRKPEFDFHFARFASQSSFILFDFVDKIEPARCNRVFDLRALAEYLGE
jgi:hypothetical protein